MTSPFSQPVAGDHRVPTVPVQAVAEVRSVPGRVPGSIVVVRVLVGVQAVLVLAGLAGTLVVGLVAAVGFALHLDMGTSGTAFVLGLAAALGVLSASACALLTAAARLTRGRRTARAVLIALQLALVPALLPAVLPLNGLLAGFLPVAAVPVLAVLLGGCAIGSLVALVAPSTRAWCRADVG